MRLRALCWCALQKDLVWFLSSFEANQGLRYRLIAWPDSGFGLAERLSGCWLEPGSGIVILPLHSARVECPVVDLLDQSAQNPLLGRVIGPGAQQLTTKTGTGGGEVVTG